MGDIRVVNHLVERNRELESTLKKERHWKARAMDTCARLEESLSLWDHQVVDLQQRCDVLEARALAAEDESARCRQELFALRQSVHTAIDALHTQIEPASPGAESELPDAVSSPPPPSGPSVGGGDGVVSELIQQPAEEDGRGETPPQRGTKRGRTVAPSDDPDEVSRVLDLLDAHCLNPKPQKKKVNTTANDTSRRELHVAIRKCGLAYIKKLWFCDPVELKEIRGAVPNQDSAFKRVVAVRAKLVDKGIDLAKFEDMVLRTPE